MTSEEHQQTPISGRFEGKHLPELIDFAEDFAKFVWTIPIIVVYIAFYPLIFTFQVFKKSIPARKKEVKNRK